MVSPTTGRFVTMFQEAASLAEVDQWLRLLDHKKLENKHAEAEQLALLAVNGSLVKRPFLVGAGVALVGFDEKKWAAALAQK